MEITVNHKLNGLSFGINRFLYSVYFPAAVSLWAFVCYALNLKYTGLFVMIAVAGLILVFVGDLLPVIPLFASCVITIKDFSLLTTVPFIVAYCLLGACFIYHFIKFPVKNFYLGKLFFPLCLVSAALFLGGILSHQGLNYYLKGLKIAFSIGPLLLVIYLLFLNGINAPKNVDVKEYVCYAVISATVCACLEVFLCYLTYKNTFLSNRNTGWGNFNTVGAMTLISLPLCCFLIIKTKKIASLFAVMVLMIATDILCSSDGSTGIALLSLPFLAIFVFITLNKHNRKHFVSFVAVIIVLLCVTCICLVSKFGTHELISFITNRTNPWRRIDLYDKAVKLFKENPVLGIGLGFSDESADHMQTYNFHSTFLHVLATMGTLGFIAYTVYFFFRFKIITGGRSPFNAFVYFSFILFEAYGLIDVCEFNAIPLMSFVTIVILTAELSNIKGEENLLPLYERYF